jgi:hypothetical protein
MKQHINTDTLRIQSQNKLIDFNEFQILSLNFYHRDIPIHILNKNLLSSVRGNESKWTENGDLQVDS